VDDPGGTPLSDKCTFADVRTLLQANLTAAVITVAAANTSALTSTGYSLTGADATSMIDLAGTWNTTGTPTALKLNVTNTASNAASLLMDLQVGGSTKFQVDRDGNFKFGTFLDSKTAVIININQGKAYVGYWFGLWLGISSTTSRYWFNATGLYLGSDRNIAWNSTATVTDNAPDIALHRDAAGILAQRSGTTAQAFRVYNTRTDASNGSWMTLDAAKTTSNVNRIISNANGTGTIRPIAIDAYAMAGAPTTSELPSGTWGVFKDSSGGSPGNVVIAYNDEGNILTASLA